MKLGERISTIVRDELGNSDESLARNYRAEQGKLADIVRKLDQERR